MPQNSGRSGFRWPRRIAPALLLAALIALTAFAVACGDDDDDDDDGGTATAAATATTASASDDSAEVVAVFEAANELLVNGDTLAFLDAGTDRFLAEVVGVVSEQGASVRQLITDDVTNNPESEGFTPLAGLEIGDASVSGDTATLDITFDNDSGTNYRTVVLTREGDTWMLDGWKARTIETPSGATEVEMTTVEFGFRFSESTVPAGDVAFQMTNAGEQHHHMGVVLLPEGVTIRQVIEYEGDPADLGAPEIGYFEAVAPGEKATWLLTDLEAGRYGYACFISDETEGAAPFEGTPHALKGMYGEFTVE